ncbi:hypothetical protein BKA56DRAFT_617520 [Ilyonectria sp. MPI-CAGE-AT-0026]|nr:hypothetical protein BKA56DRAFT_617520 [Ilyonectria sp. MPI-CAGE-AT-0026]
MSSCLLLHARDRIAAHSRSAPGAASYILGKAHDPDWFQLSTVSSPGTDTQRLSGAQNEAIDRPLDRLGYSSTHPSSLTECPAWSLFQAMSSSLPAHHTVMKQHPSTQSGYGSRFCSLVVEWLPFFDSGCDPLWPRMEHFASPRLDRPMPASDHSSSPIHPSSRYTDASLSQHYQCKGRDAMLSFSSCMSTDCSGPRGVVLIGSRQRRHGYHPIHATPCEAMRSHVNSMHVLSEAARQGRNKQRKCSTHHV